MSIDRFNHKRKMAAFELLAKTRRQRLYPACDPPAISFEELGVPFQWCGLLDLREAGILTMGTTGDGKAGVVLKRPYADMTISEFQDTYKHLIERK